jgi:hypothetical protein
MVFSMNIFRDRQYILGLDGRFVNTVHDSVLGYCPKKNGIDYLRLLEYTCNNPLTKEYFKFDFGEVPLKTDFELGPNWGTLTEVQCALNQLDLSGFNTSDSVEGKYIDYKKSFIKIEKELDGNKILINFDDETQELDKNSVIYAKINS